MSEKIIVVTPPDDIWDDAERITLVDLNPEQSKTISDIITSVDITSNIVIYNFQHLNDEQWLVDKIQKSQLVFYNAESDNQLLVGYLLNNKNAYSLGVRRGLDFVNNRKILEQQEIRTMIENLVNGIL